MQTVSNPPPRCCEHAARAAELERQLAVAHQQLADVRRLLLAAAGRAFDPQPGEPAGTSGAHLRAVG